MAWAGGGLLGLGACAVYFARVSGGRGFFGGLFLAAGLLASVAAADQAKGRSEVATCAVREVHTERLASYGEGGPPRATVYRLDLRCPGGYPAVLKADRAVAATGQEVRVAYDPERRVSPAVQGDTSPWAAGVGAAALRAADPALGGGGQAGLGGAETWDGA
ncbi:hypothetical protein, partial [Streptomyces sp. NPDC048565]|uniref:hypothetical protein n=1 Tax=Streptomyces sp. NPDC048565 TaxID=3155266 RepID=UPI0034399A99